MAGILSSLSGAANALQTHSRSVEQTGKNIANVNNPDYARQRVLTGNFGSHRTSFGVDSGNLVTLGIEQVRDRFIDRQILGERSYQSELENREFRLRQALANLGDNIDRAGDAQFVNDIAQQGGGLRGAIDGFFNSFEAFAARPGDATTRQVVVQEAKALVDTFHRVDGRFTLLGNELDQQIEDEVGALNTRLQELQGLNREIARMEIGKPGSALDLRDQRQAKLEEIAASALIEVSEVGESLGQISLGMRDTEGGLVELVGPGKAVRELRFNQESRRFEVSGTGEELQMESGKLSALQDVRDGAITVVREDLDRLANTLATEVNSLYYQAYAPSRGVDPEIPESAFFQQPIPPPGAGAAEDGVTAATIELYHRPSDPDTVLLHQPLTAESLRSSESDLAGANDLAMAMGDLATRQFSELGNLQFSDFALRRTTELAQDIQGVQNRMEVQRDVLEVLENRRGEVSGVSMDEEVANLVQYQRAFQASSRYFNVLSEMLDTLINSLGR